MVRLLWVGVVPIACTTILNIDGHYVSSTGTDVDAAPEAGNSERRGSGGEGSGGQPAVGGAGAPSGGTPSSEGGNASMSGGSGGAPGGAIGSGGVLDDCTQRGCLAGLKCCGSSTAPTKACYSPSPLVGCGDTGCEYCSGPIPSNSIAKCIGNVCGFECNTGYTEKNGACVVRATGGAGGTDGGGVVGMGGAKCVDRGCAGCGPAGIFGCCLPSGNCGCTFFNIEIGGSASIGYCLPRPDSILPPR